MLRTHILPLACLLLLSASYPVGLTEAPPATDSGLFELYDLAYLPLPLPLYLRIAYGRSETLETNLELMVSPGIPGSVVSGYPYGFGTLNAGARYGAKNRFQTKPVELTFDFGGSLYAPGFTINADAGLLAAVPLGDVKLYGGLHGFGVLARQPQPFGGSAYGRG